METQSYNPKALTAEQFKTVATEKHKEMCRSFAANILQAFDRWKGPKEEFVVALVDIGEDLIDTKEKFRLKAKGADTAFVETSKGELKGLLENFESPRNKQRVFEQMSAALDVDIEGKIPVCAFCFQNGGLYYFTREELEANAKEAAALKARFDREEQEARERAALSSAPIQVPPQGPQSSEP